MHEQHPQVPEAHQDHLDRLEREAWSHVARGFEAALLVLPAEHPERDEFRRSLEACELAACEPPRPAFGS